MRCSIIGTSLLLALPVGAQPVPAKPAPAKAAPAKAAPAQAAPAKPAPPKPIASAKVQAGVAYQAGVVAYRAKKYEVALAQFEAAFQLDPSPVLLFNLARVHEARGATSKAIAHFERYLARVPTADDRPDVEARLVRLRAQQRTMQPAEPEPAISTWLGWGAVGIAVVGVAVGGVSLAAAAGTRNEAQDLGPTVLERRRYDALQGDFERQQALGWVGLGVGLAFAATGTALLLSAEGAEGHVGLAPSIGGVVLQGAF